MIICTSGKRGSGKSLLAHYLKEYGFYPVSLATELKERCLKDFPLLTKEQVYGKDKESPTGYVRENGHPLTSRDIMIRMGVFYRSVDSLYWCKILWEKMVLLGHENYVIDDIRFANEVNFFKQYPSRFVRLERSQELNVYKGAMDDLSETELDRWGEWDFKLEAPFNQVPKDLEKFAQYISEHIRHETRI